MKKLLTFLFLIHSINYGLTQEIKIEKKSNILKNYFYLSTLPFLSNTFQINYERISPNNKKSILISGGLILNKSYDININWGFTDEIHFRFYLNDIRNTGTNKFKFAFYFSPYFAHKHEKVEYYIIHYDNYDLEYINSFSIGSLSGIKGVLGRFALDIYTGGGIQKSITNNNDQNKLYNSKNYRGNNYTGILPKLGIQLGFSF